MTNDTTSDRIVAAALQLFVQQGVKKTDLDEVAHQAGVTRVTVYRYFGDKQGLVRATCLRIAGAFGRAAEDGPVGSVQDMDERLGRLAAELSDTSAGQSVVAIWTKSAACIRRVCRVPRVATGGGRTTPAADAGSRPARRRIARRSQPGRVASRLLVGGDRADREPRLDQFRTCRSPKS